LGRKAEKQQDNPKRVGQEVLKTSQPFKERGLHQSSGHPNGNGQHPYFGQCLRKGS